MNVNTWQDFIRKANDLSQRRESDPLVLEQVKDLESSVEQGLEHSCFGCSVVSGGLDYFGGLQIELPSAIFLEGSRKLPFDDSVALGSLIEDMQDSLLDSCIYGISEIRMSGSGPNVVVELRHDTTGQGIEGYAKLLRGLKKWEDKYHVVEKSVCLYLQEHGYISQVLIEEKGRMRQHGIYRFGCLIEYEITTGDRQRGLDDIVSDIRAIPTVTIVSVVVGNERISEKRYVAGLRIKYIPSYPGNLAQPEEAKAYILRLIKRLKNVKSVSRVTLKTDRIE